MSPRKKRQLRFEEALARLESIAERTEATDVGLEELINLVEEGMTLLRDCRTQLEQAELRIQKLNNPDTAQEQHQATPTEQDNEFSLI